MELSHWDLMPSQQKTGSLIVPQAWGRANCTDGIHGDTVAQLSELVEKGQRFYVISARSFPASGRSQILNAVFRV